jgi:3-isopropylmalate/(R)-2-methylmalate dehydratase large subunit
VQAVQRPGVRLDAAEAYWRTLPTDEAAVFDAEVTLDAGQVTPFVTWGTNPGQGAPLSAAVPDPEEFVTESERAAARRALEYMDLRPGTSLRELPIDVVFVGSCTNGRLEDLRAAADVLRGHRVADGVRMLVVPGSAAVREAAEAEGLDKVFADAGAEWRFAGCSMCLGMNPDTAPGERSIDSSRISRAARAGAAHLVYAGRRRHAVVGQAAAPADL